MKQHPYFVRFLIASNIILISFVAFIFLTGFDKNDKLKDFKEINVERINVIGTTGKPVLVISNRRLMPGPTINGKTYDRDVIDGREYMSGMIFFNELGDEVGGIQYAGIKKDATGYSAVGHLSFDQWNQNQVMALDYNDKSGNRYAGMRIWDRPTNASFDYMLDLMAAIKEADGNKPRLDSLYKLWNEAKARGENGVERMFIGSKNEVAQIQLKDKQGNVRARLYVDEHGDAKMEFLDEKAGTIAVFPK
ncbi:MAG: hypothetical protein IPL50_19095 [Chitinophagaceae bacterium]|nr:hypothetical protein [Chitinophagaceae bacterium]